MDFPQTTAVAELNLPETSSNRLNTLGPEEPGIVIGGKAHRLAPDSYRVRTAADLEERPLQWLWPDRIPAGKLTLLVGESGAGKSLLALELAARLSRGEPWPIEEKHADSGEVWRGRVIGEADESSKPVGRVVLACGSVQAELIRLRLQRAGADLQNILTVEPNQVQPQEVADDGDDPPESRVHLPVELAAIEAVLAEADQPRLLIIDAIEYETSGRRRKVESELESIFRQLEKLADRYDVAVLAVLPLEAGAKGGRRLAQWMRGPTVRSIWTVEHNPIRSDERWLCAAKMHLGPDPPGHRLRVNGGRIGWERELMAGSAVEVLERRSRPGPVPHLRREAADWLRKMLLPGRRAARDLLEAAAAAGFSATTLRRAKSDMGVRAVRDWYDASGGWYWVLPPEQTPVYLADSIDSVAQGCQVDPGCQLDSDPNGRGVQSLQNPVQVDQDAQDDQVEPVDGRNGQGRQDDQVCHVDDLDDQDLQDAQVRGPNRRARPATGAVKRVGDVLETNHPSLALSVVTEPQSTTRLTRRPRIGRNDPCSCGSGRKYKKCCGASQ